MPERPHVLVPDKQKKKTQKTASVLAKVSAATPLSLLEAKKKTNKFLNSVINSERLLAN